jgi:hypothetical protein
MCDVDIRVSYVGGWREQKEIRSVDMFGNGHQVNRSCSASDVYIWSICWIRDFEVAFTHVVRSC